MGIHDLPLRDPVLESHAQLARGYVEMLRQVDSLKPVRDITMGNLPSAKKETLDLLKRLGEFQISRTLFEIIGPVEVAGDRPGKENKSFLEPPATPLQLMVARSRDLGASWSEIGEHLGMTQQGAHKAYAHIFERLDS